MNGLHDCYKGKRVLVTGHTGFKGSWLAYWLTKMGAEVYGFGRLPHTYPNHHSITNHDNWKLHGQYYGDLVSEWRHVTERFSTWQPDIVFHLAANAIVAKTFDEPRETFESNVMGAVNILEACRLTPSVKAVVMITTDKVYSNKEWKWGYRENDELGGLDPYSASKVCVEHVIECYRSQFFPNIATARAGNVIGGGDWAYKRLIPDIVRATVEGKPVEIHTPYATRPWQHVLEPLYGYLLLGKKLLDGNHNTLDNFNRAWNFGPEGEMTVLDVLDVAHRVWAKIEYVVKEEETHPSMVTLLKIDSTEARNVLGWKPRWDMEHAVGRAIRWYREFYEEGKVITDEQIRDYEEGL